MPHPRKKRVTWTMVQSPTGQRYVARTTVIVDAGVDATLIGLNRGVAVRPTCSMLILASEKMLTHRLLFQPVVSFLLCPFRGSRLLYFIVPLIKSC